MEGGLADPPSFKRKEVKPMMEWIFIVLVLVLLLYIIREIKGK